MVDAAAMQNDVLPVDVQSVLRMHGDDADAEGLDHAIDHIAAMRQFGFKAVERGAGG